MIKEYHDSDKYKQSSIFVINKNDHERCLYEGKGAGLLQQNISTVILPLQQEQSDSIFLASLKDDGLLNAGSILVQSPYDSEKYVVASSALLQFSIDKYMYFSQLCQFLGAKEVTVNKISSKNKDERKSLNLGLSYADNKISANYKDEELERLKSSLELSDTFEGSEPDIKGAERLLRTYRLKSDSEMKALLQMRSIGTNTLKSRKLKINLTQEAKRELSMLAKVEIPHLLNIDTSFEKQVQGEIEYELQVTVKF